MKNNEKLPRTIEGDWDWRETSMNLPEGWRTINEKEPGEHIWSFIGNQMVSREWNTLRYAVYYRYDPDKLRLRLDGWQLDGNGEREMLVKEWYRVEFVSATEMYLYDLEGVEPGEAESLRLTLRKI